MKPLERLKTLINETYTDYDGETYSIVLEKGLNEEEILHFEKQLPSKLPEDIKELIRFSSGFEFYIYNISFIGNTDFGFEELIKNPITLAGDGTGNCWVVEILNNGDWGNVFYVCHDPAVIVKHSEHLSQFLEHLSDYGKNGSASHFDIIHEEIVYELNRKSEYLTLEEAQNSQDQELRVFTEKLEGDYLIADLRNKPLRSGFEWGKFTKGSNYSIIRHDNLQLWALLKPKPSVFSTFFKKIFG